MPQIFFGRVMHKRLFPKVNAFHYKIFYLAIPLSKLDVLQDNKKFGVNKPAPMSFYEIDHGPRDGSPLNIWIKNILQERRLYEADGEIILIAMPRFFGHVFNPVSFWLCLDKQKKVRAVLYEVNNTFGETHSYIAYHDDHRPIEKDDTLSTQKLFHVSPFLEREGRYTFRLNYDYDNKKFDAWIDFFDASGQKKLITSLNGTLKPYSNELMRKAFWRYPFVSLVALSRIHWQAIKLWFKGIQYVPRPVQLGTKLTRGKLNETND